MSSQHIVDGPTLSPHIVLRAHVRMVWRIFIDVFHVSDMVMSLINFDLATISGKRTSGTWKRKDVDLKRYGRGGLDIIVYAITLLLVDQLIGLKRPEM